MTAGRLFDAFNELMLLHGLEPYPPHFARNMQRAFEGVIRWCRERGIDPERWIIARHEAVQWRVRLPPKRLTQATPAFIESFMDWRDSRATETQSQMAMMGTAEEGGHSTYLSEALKRTFAAEPDLCVVAPETAHDPHSRWCQRCTQAGVCHARG